LRTVGEDLTRVLGELQELHCELVERRGARLRAAGEALARLGDTGSRAAIIAGAAEALGAHTGFDAVLVSGLDTETLRPQALWIRDDAAAAHDRLAELQRRSIPVRYPLAEAEVARRHEPACVAVDGGRAALADVLEWPAYAVAGVAIEGKSVGFVHAARSAGVDDLDVALVARCADALARAFERAVLREQLDREQAQLQAAARWIAGQMHQLGELGTPATSGRPDLAALLTARELDVLRLLARGQSNRAIAAALLIGEGTVKYHVKNILRKLGARGRTDAVSRYMRADGR
jgi:LuxR family transcriptional regulator, regulator of acetate metabolism